MSVCLSVTHTHTHKHTHTHARTRTHQELGAPGVHLVELGHIIHVPCVPNGESVRAEGVEDFESKSEQDQWPRRQRKEDIIQESAEFFFLCGVWGAHKILDRADLRAREANEHT
jgi:hypothetical protein